MNTATSPFSLLLELYPAPKMSRVLGQDNLVRAWVAFEHALANSQAQAAILSGEDARSINAITAESIDHAALWDSAKNVGYPILPLVRQISAQLPDGPNGRVHYGATTQDVMDTGQSLQLRDACDVLTELVTSVGTHLASLVAAQSATVMPGRTHGQQAVPTTFGAHLAPLLGEIARSLPRLTEARNSAATLSLYGAGGTSAALGPKAHELRAHMAEELGLNADDVSWHTARDRVVVVAQVCMLLAGTCARLARNVIDLSRTEIGEVSEASGEHRGASSTMPQKANPISAEGIIGMSAMIGPLVASLSRIMEMPQERSAGEWQIEWHVIPQILQLTASTLVATDDLLSGLQINEEAMSDNLNADGGLIMSEAAMIALAGSLGRETAHDIVYQAALEVRSSDTDLTTAIENILREKGLSNHAAVPQASGYLGEAELMCKTAVSAWKNSEAGETP